MSNGATSEHLQPGVRLSRGAIGCVEDVPIFDSDRRRAGAMVMSCVVHDNSSGLCSIELFCGQRPMIQIAHDPFASAHSYHSVQRCDHAPQRPELRVAFTDIVEEGGTDKIRPATGPRPDVVRRTERVTLIWDGLTPEHETLCV